MAGPDINRIRTAATVDATGQGLLVFNFTGYLTGRRGTITRMIASVAESGGALLRDNFGRTVAAGGWGTPDFGPAWVALEEAATLSVDGARGRSSTAVVTRNAIHSPIAATDAEILYLLTRADTGTGGSTTDQARALLRVQNLDNYYYAAVGNFFTANAQSIRISKRVAAVETDLVSSVLSVNALLPPIWTRFSVIGTALAMKAWRYGDDEPIAPSLTTTDAAIATAGGAGWGSTAPGATAEDFSIDSLVVAPGSAVVTVSPTWDAFIGDTSNPSNLIDSSQGVILPRWVPALVNGQPVSQGDILTIVASGGTPGQKLVASCYLASEVVPAGDVMT